MARNLKRSKSTVTLSQLVKKAQRKGLRPDDPDRSLELVARDCGISRQHLYNLMNGQVDPSKVREYTVHRLSKGLGVSRQLVIEAMHNTEQSSDLLD